MQTNGLVWHVKNVPQGFSGATVEVVSGAVKPVGRLESYWTQPGENEVSFK